MDTIADLAAQTFDKREYVKMLETMNTPLDYVERKKAFVELELAKRAVAEAEIALRSI